MQDNSITFYAPMCCKLRRRKAVNLVDKSACLHIRDSEIINILELTHSNKNTATTYRDRGRLHAKHVN